MGKPREVHKVSLLAQGGEGLVLGLQKSIPTVILPNEPTVVKLP